LQEKSVKESQIEHFNEIKELQTKLQGNQERLTAARQMVKLSQKYIAFTTNFQLFMLLDIQKDEFLLSFLTKANCCKLVIMCYLMYHFSTDRDVA